METDRVSLVTHCLVTALLSSIPFTNLGKFNRGRSTYPWRGKEIFDRCGSCSSPSDLDIFGTSAPSYPSFQRHQRGNMVLMKELESRVGTLERSDWLASSEKNHMVTRLSGKLRGRSWA